MRLSAQIRKYFLTQLADNVTDYPAISRRYDNLSKSQEVYQPSPFFFLVCIKNGSCGDAQTKSCALLVSKYREKRQRTCRVASATA